MNNTLANCSCLLDYGVGEDYKEEDQYIIRWKGGKMKEDAVSQCPVASFMVWGEALSGKISRLSL